MPERTSITIGVGSLWTRGDLVKAPEGTASKIRNCVFRRGIVEKRSGFLRESEATAPGAHGILLEYAGPSENILITGAVADGDGKYRNSNATWTDMGVSCRYGGVEQNSTMYLLGSESATEQSAVASFDGTTVTNNATLTRIGGTGIASIIGRIAIGSPKFYYSNGGAYYFEFNSAGQWTVSGSWSQPSGTTIRTATIAHATNDAIKSTAAVYTTGGSADEYVTFVFEVQSISATVSTPITVTIEDSAGTSVYGSREYVASNATDAPGWQQFHVTALCPMATALYGKLKIGNSTGGGTVGVQLRLADSTADHGFSAYPGHFVYPFGAQDSYATTDGLEYKNRVYWSEALDVTDWRNENFTEIDEVSGYVTAMGVVNDRLVVLKRGGIWVFRPTESATRPFFREVFFPRIGCIEAAALTVFDNVMYFVGDNEVYAFDGTSQPRPLCGDAVKDEVFDSQITAAAIAVDTDNRELWVYAKPYRIYIYSVDDEKWLGYYQLTDVSASEEPFSSHGKITGMTYAQPRGESSREMWLNFTTATDVTTCLKLRAAQTLDDIDGAGTYDVVAEYVFHALETPRWRRPMTVQIVGIDHKITGSQSASVTEYAISVDGGSTWGKYNQVRLPVSSGGAGDTDPIRVPVHQTAPRVMVKVKHTGLAGETYFNLTGAEASVILRGREIQGTNPTAVGSSL